MIGISVTYSTGEFQRLSRKLSDFERRQVLHQTVEEVGAFLLPKLKKYPPRRYVSRKAAYGRTFFSDRQRRWFFAALRSGELSIPYGRSGTLAAGWEVQPVGTQEVRLVNSVGYAGYVMGDTQSRHEKLVGWRTVRQYVREYGGQIGRIALTVIRAWLRG